MPTSSELIGAKVIELILANAASKIDLNGEPFAPYSFGYYLKKKYKKRSKAKSKKGKAKFLQDAKNAYESGKNNVTLVTSGAMLNSISVINIDEEARNITIGFEDAEAAKVAFYHNISGAGKGRILRRFFGVKKGGEAELFAYATEILSKDLNFAVDVLTPYLRR